RLASNSLLEGMVFAERLVHKAKDDELAIYQGMLSPWESYGYLSRELEQGSGGQGLSGDRGLLNHSWDEIRRVMWNYVGIIRSTKRLKMAHAKIRGIQSEIDEYYWNNELSASLCELRNLCHVAYLTVLCALKRRESRGCHYTIDYPSKLDVAKDTII
ncbi:MAG: L-aspartate oxidase, partial [Proteobacteria bacterium]|nr:L-aspartate oxidase [Pseudomonadota bacterium]